DLLLNSHRLTASVCHCLATDPPAPRVTLGIRPPLCQPVLESRQPCAARGGLVRHQAGEIGICLSGRAGTAVLGRVMVSTPWLPKCASMPSTSMFSGRLKLRLNEP